jgi:hypothetical protein
MEPSVSYITLPEAGQPTLPPYRDKQLVIEKVTMRGTGTVYLLPYVRVTAETKRGYRRLMAYITVDGVRTELCLATAEKRDFNNVLQRLRELAELMYFYGDLDRSVADAIESFPIEQWLWVMMRGYDGGASYFEGLGDNVFDDGRKLTLDPMVDGETQRLELWRGLRLIYEHNAGDRRLSMYLYHSKTKSKSRVLSTRSNPDLTRARAVIAVTLDEYRASGRKIPDELVARLPLEQWFEEMTAEPNAKKENRETPGPESLLTIQPTKGKLVHNSQARWTISQSVVLSFQERIDRPSLFLHERVKPDSPKMTHERLSSIPIADFQRIRGRLRRAVIGDMLNNSIDFGGMGTPLISRDSVMDGNSLDYARLDAAIDALPLAGMIGFYDQATLSMRRNGHRKRIYPEYDYDMRWISKAGPETHTATEDCWWVLIGDTRIGRGAVFPFNGDAEAALLEAKAWRNELEGANNIAPIIET